MGGVGNPEELEATEATFVLDELKALAMAMAATAATVALPDPGGTGIKGGGTGKCEKFELAEVAEDGVRLNEEFIGPKAVTIGLFGAVWEPFVDERSTAPEMEVGVDSRSGNMSPGPALFGDLLWKALFRPDSTKCLFLIGRHSLGKSPGDFGTLACGELGSASKV